MSYRAKLHLPFDQWPLEDRLLWEQANNDGDPFGEATGTRLADTSKHQYLFAWRRFLGYGVYPLFRSAPPRRYSDSPDPPDGWVLDTGLFEQTAAHKAERPATLR